MSRPNGSPWCSTPCSSSPSRRTAGVVVIWLGQHDLEGRMSGQDFKVAVGMKDACGGSNRRRGNQAIDKSPHRFALSTTGSGKGGGFLIVGWCGGEKGSSSQHPAQINQVLLVSRTGKDFHTNWVARRD